MEAGMKKMCTVLMTGLVVVQMHGMQQEQGEGVPSGEASVDARALPEVQENDIPRPLSPDQELVTAVYQGNIQGAKAALVAGADINKAGEFGNTPLHCAVSDHATGSLPMVNFLLQRKANVNAKNMSGNTPLHEAKTDEIVHRLLNGGALLEVKNDNGETPLARACFRAAYVEDGEAIVGVIKTLIAKRADVNARDAMQETALASVARMASDRDGNSRYAQAFRKTRGTREKETIKRVMALLIEAGAQRFDTKTLQSQEVREFVERAFAERDERVRKQEARERDAKQQTSLDDIMLGQHWQS